MPISQVWLNAGQKNMVQELDDLPKSGSKYWTDVDADVEVHTPHLKHCEHVFARTAGNEVECTKCHIGFISTPDFKLKDGHIYLGNKLVI